DRSVQPVHFDVTFDETVTALAPLKTWTLHVGESFADVNNDTSIDPFYPKIETILHKGVTGGCAVGPPALFCPSSNVLRQEMAPSRLKAFPASDSTPPDSASFSAEVPCPAPPESPSPTFTEAPTPRGTTGGCAVGPPPTFCPGDPVTRAQMAPFLLKTL